MSHHIPAFSYQLTAPKKGEYPFHPYVVIRAQEQPTPQLATVREIDTYCDQMVEALRAECSAAKRALSKALPG